ncbi:MAG: sensor histidine kinase, partial [Solirubrobacterales bacterium]
MSSHNHSHAPEGTPEGFHHEAVFYAGLDDFLTFAEPFLRDAVELHHPTLVAVSERKGAELRRALGDHDDGVMIVDMVDIGANPGRIIPAWKEFLAGHGGPGQTLRGIGEPIWADRTPAQLAEAEHMEHLLNLAFEDAESFWIACPYDTDTLSSTVIDNARRTHPVLSHAGVTTVSDAYVDPEVAGVPFVGELERAPTTAVEAHFSSVSDLAALRGLTRRVAADSGLSASRASDLSVAVNELATNSLLHASGRGVLRAWSDTANVYCEISDAGLIEDRLIGRIPPSPGQVSGYGVWLVNQLC